jgi:(p)ppGpp synthase/HD superfamily hydrolase
METLDPPAAATFAARNHPALSPRFDEALVWASELHRGQLRKIEPIPYVTHCISVAALVLENGGGEDEAIAALLHDGPEDCGGWPVLEEIARRFGDRVAELVDGCTDTYDTPKPAWRPRKERYLARLAAECAAVRLIAAADKLHNARSILSGFKTEGNRVFDRFSPPREETLWYYRAVTDVLRARDAGPLVEELDRAVCELEALPTGS